uniref:Glutamic acid decarboxylase n=1 Tax=Dugesia japonica TaxID=6161 RepID=B2ZX20_DUGJA|nr:glutamic acid decarboxylase [Dugesia japonica]
MKHQPTSDCVERNKKKVRRKNKFVTKSYSLDKQGLCEAKRLSKKLAINFRGQLNFDNPKKQNSLFNQNQKSKLLTGKTNYDPDWTNFEGCFATDESFQESQETEFLQEIVELLLDYLKKMRIKTSKVLDFHHPHQLKQAMAHCMEIPDTPKDLEQLLSDCKETLKYCVKTGHSRYFNQISCGLDAIAVAGEFLTAMANTNMFTYEIAPVFTLMEEVTLQKLRDLIGWSSGDGIFSPGGTIANLYAILAARFAYYPDVKTRGLFDAPRLIIFTSEQAHYSIKRAAIISGFGLNQVKLVKCNERGKMDTENLIELINESIENKNIPCMVCSTGGTTVLGAFDPIDEISKICKRFGLWLHVDCAWGSGALLSKSHRYLLNGIENADSVTWNPHKAMAVTLQCSVILFKKESILENCNGLCADYLFQKDKNYDTRYDTGDKSIQCGRRNDVFKLWLMWRSKGDEGFQNQINELFILKDYLCKIIKEKNGFEMVIEKPEYLNICFWYIPEKYRKIDTAKEKFTMLHEVTAKIKQSMLESGTTMISYQPLFEKPNFFRLILSNPSCKVEDIDFVVDEIVKLGEEINLK